MGGNWGNQYREIGGNIGNIWGKLGMNNVDQMSQMNFNCIPTCVFFYKLLALNYCLFVIVDLCEDFGGHLGLMFPPSLPCIF